MAAFLELNKCPVCGKEFVPAPQHQYKMEGGKKIGLFLFMRDDKHTGMERKKEKIKGATEK